MLRFEGNHFICPLQTDCDITTKVAVQRKLLHVSPSNRLQPRHRLQFEGNHFIFPLKTDCILATAYGLKKIISFVRLKQVVP